MCNIAYGEVFSLLNKYLKALKRKTPVLLGSAKLDIVAFINIRQYPLGYSDIELARKYDGTFLYGKESQLV